MTEKPSNPKDIIGSKKATFSVLPANVITEIAIALTEGASKYGRHNYRIIGVRASVYYDATLRHLLSWWEGECIDPDSGLSHITKAISSLVVLRDAMMNEKLEDDRPPRSKPFFDEANRKTALIIEKHSDKSPTHYTWRDS